MDIGATLGIKFRGRKSYNLKKCVEIEEVEIAKRIRALDDLEEGGLEYDEDFEDDVSLWNF